MATTTIFFLLVYDFVYEKFRWIIFYLSLSHFLNSRPTQYFFEHPRVSATCDRCGQLIPSKGQTKQPFLPTSWLFVTAINITSLYSEAVAGSA